MQSPFAPASPSLALATNLNAVINQSQTLDSAMSSTLKTCSTLIRSTQHHSLWRFRI